MLYATKIKALMMIHMLLCLKLNFGIEIAIWDINLDTAAKTNRHIHYRNSYGCKLRLEETRSVKYKPLGGDLRSIIEEHHKCFILDVIAENSTITLEELRLEVISHFDDVKNVSVSTLCKYLRHFVRITLKRATPIEEKRNNEITLAKRHDFILSLQPEGILYYQNCIFIDEAGFNFNLIKGRARTKAGQPALVMTSQIFKNFVQQLVEKLDRANAGPYHLVVDNARIHYNSSLREWLEQINKHTLRFLPPYSLFLNSVEKCFSKLFFFVKKHPLDSQKTLMGRIKDGSHSITKRDCEGWFSIQFIIT
ncbi:Homeodomain-like DNA binding domain-containing transcription factor [Phycomyces blakesleeanus NRRL 1555(-)]|uniref:Homeodomain-like DNA binding domain-containing transcription factor n=1 Tax=Phycomyces blakesleeanus (strain ATCC 8743b / DSM 1359 / FGSC 10004 / NBRC 33097 / NRRL 1555) TaxID=763407 RepID=A0A162ZT37_PHYB8|nr:Homeodomain-like DNA binding domain-containing transcription factor [Phycomyces blakesleeanus NRRL 1555(-)]OAD68851.1 Homeodomain-like DNA binding domain-containing transcription factor [Phycomyces blakesleeanus NRRL 1555(-)]|eukprot:XP_018286891.1 Homeodomain-like DNA binding domain-containing transcription factor [Phycomyces blakesleeanus NRRL 1555(-)]